MKLSNLKFIFSRLAFILLTLALFNSCESFDISMSDNENTSSDFDFQNTSEVEFSLYVLNSNGNALQNVPLSVYSSDPFNDEGIFV